jgi:hypothetical protein
MKIFSEEWADKVSNTAQAGGIETSVLDNGPGRGNRIAWVNTGAGLRYKVVLDRAMDIAEAFFNGYSLCWISHQGTTAPLPMSDQGIAWLRTFGGGLLTTCGLSHVGGPEEDAYGHRGLHGRISNTPAEVLSIEQPDPLRGKMDMSLSGRMIESQVLGTHLELKRTISSKLGESALFIEDTVTNRGNQSAPLMVLYHLNLGWPLVDEGAKIFWEGDWRPREAKADRKIFREDHDYYTCPAPLPAHSGAGEEACFIDPVADASGMCTCGVLNPGLGVALRIRFKKEQLPCLTNWQHWGLREYVTGLEPGTHYPTGQRQARQDGTLIFLEPGASQKMELIIDAQTIHQK